MRNYILLIWNMWIYIYYIYIIMHNYMLKILLGWSYECWKTTATVHILYTHWMSVNNC